MSLIFFTGPLPLSVGTWPALGDLLWRQFASVEKEAHGTTKIRFRGPGLAALAGDVVQVVHRVVDEVPGEGLDGEAGPIAAPAGPLPLTAGHAGEPAGDGLPGLGQRDGDLGGILVCVAVGHGGRVLVP